MILYVLKGFEFFYVFFMGMEEELLFYCFSIEEDNIEEECCLMYVGIICVKKEFIMIYIVKCK